MGKRKLKKRVLCVAALSIAASSILGASTYFYGKKNTSGYSSYDQTVELQNYFNAVSDYRMSNGERLQYNIGEPIYVSIGKGFSDEQEEVIRECVDKFFTLLHDINDNYSYEFVDTVHKLKYVGKVTYEFKTGDVGEYNAVYMGYDYWFVNGEVKKLNHDNDIIYDAKQLSRPIESFCYTTMHELAHSLGIDDVYTQNVVNYYNTIINGNVSSATSITDFTPNDYKLLLSWYAKDMRGMSESEKAQYIQELDQKYEKYRQDYYNHFTEVFKEDRYSSMKNYKEVTASNPYYFEQMPKNLDLVFYNFSIISPIRTIHVVVNNGRYTLSTMDMQNQVVDTCSGNAFTINNQMILEGVFIKDLDGDKPTYQDLFLFRPPQSTAYFMENVFGNQFVNETAIIDMIDSQYQNGY